MGEFVFKMNEPKDYEYLLLCDGSTISEENYPELVAVLGGTQLPNLIDRFLQGSATAGTYKAVGLPNIDGTFVADGFGSATGLDSGAFSSTYLEYSYTSASVNKGVYKYTFDASKSNSIYGNSTAASIHS